MSKWRTGRKVGRTLYAMQGDDPSDDDVLIGLLDSRMIAESIVEDHNWFLRCAKPFDEPDDDRPRRRGYR